MQSRTTARVLASFWLVAAFLLACGGGGGGSTASPPPPQVAITAPTKVTEGDKRTASATAIPGATYTWTIQNGTITAGNGTSSIAYTVGTPGSLKLTVAAASTTATATMDVLPLPIINSFQATPSIIYVGDSTQLSADFINGVGNIQPGNLAITSGVPITVSPVVDTIYTLNDTNEAGGNAVFAILVKVLPLDATPTPIITAPSSVTASQAGYVASVPAVAGATYAWTITTATVTAGAGTDAITFTPGASGTVGLSCVVTNPHSTPSSPGTATAAIVAGPITPVITAPASVNAFQAGYTASVPAQAGCTFNWSVTNGTVTGGGGATNFVTFTAGASGTVDFSCTATNAAGTVSSAGMASSTIVPLPPPSIASFTASPSTISSGDDAVLSATFSGGTGVITPGDLAISSGGSVGVSALTGTQTYTLTVTNAASVSVTASATVTVAPGLWSATGTMNDLRQGHTETRLLDGQILITGGLDEPSVSIITDLYDSSTGLFTRSGDLTSLPGRAFHTATLLQDGRVLVTGGTSTAGTLATAELYDPATGTFSPTGSMATPRWRHTATLLPNGKVLVQGEGDNPSPVPPAELYDPATGLFAPTGTPSVSRSGSTATLLANGLVLVVGQGNPELYDPATGAFSPTGSLGARNYLTATLLPDGKVLIAGGRTSTSLAEADLYDPGTGQFTPTGSLIAARSHHTAMLLPNGKVLLTGGADTSFGSMTSSELYDPGTGTFGPTGHLAVPRYDETATLLSNGHVLIAGGYDSHATETWLASAELYDPQDATPGFPVVLYTPAALAFTAGAPITAVAPLGSGGSVWSVAPALPAGLSLDPSTGAITGTPTASTAAQAYVVTASNGTNSSSTYLWIEVTP